MSTYQPSLAEMPLFPQAPDKQLKIAVIIPVKNEEDGLFSTLEALRLQVDDCGDKLDEAWFEILLLANNCTDKSAAIARNFQATYPELKLHVAEIELEKAVAHIGTVRRLLMDEAYERFKNIGNTGGIIVSTDGDSEVDRHWLHYIIHEVDKGSDVVGGRILPRSIPKLSKIHHLRDVSYRYYISRLESILDPCNSDPWPRHFQCYGPSLAVTCEMYEKAGRIPAIPFLEDEEFRKALYRVDAKVRKSPLVKVYTSSRLTGQVEFGFSVQLQRWENMTLENRQQHVETLVTLIQKMTVKNELRQLWIGKNILPDINSRLMALSSTLMIDHTWMTQQFSDCSYYGELWEKIENEIEKGPWRLNNQLGPIAEVIKELRQYFSVCKTAS